MIRLRWKEKWIDFESVEWSGTENQCSRQVTFTIPSNPYDKSFEKLAIKLGDLVYLYDGTKQLFVGTVTQREKTAEIGTASYTAMDFMHHLLRSNGTYKFTKTTPEKITKKVCSDVKVGTTKLATTKCNIAKMFFEDACIYDIIISAYRKAKALNGKKYMPVMVGNKVSVIEKGKSSGVKLVQGVSITDASYSDTTDNMVDRVVIFNDKKKKLGQVEEKKNVSSYGVYQQVYAKEDGVDAKKQAKAMLVGITKEASIESIGDINAISGYSIQIDDKATGLSGKFYIESDTHTFSDGVHTMSLELSYENSMEEGTDYEGTSKKVVANNEKCYYLSSSTVYHSRTSCPACKGKNTKKTTVEKIKKIKITAGKNKGKRKYKACSKCWMS